MTNGGIETMTAKTHILGGILAGQMVVLTGAVDLTAALPLLAAAATGALVPDIDHRGSKISRSSLAGQVTAFGVSVLTTHRGPIHTPAFILASALCLGTVSYFADGSWWLAVFLGLLIGMLSHLLLDSLNPGGIMWLWPISKKRLHLMAIRTNSLSELLVTGILLMLNLTVVTRFFPEIARAVMQLLPGGMFR